MSKFMSPTENNPRNLALLGFNRGLNYPVIFGIYELEFSIAMKIEYGSEDFHIEERDCSLYMILHIF